MRHKLFIAVSAALLLVLAACGGPGVKPPDPPSQVTVTPGPGVLHVVWVQDDLRTTGYIIYRAPRNDPAARIKLANVSRDPNDHQLYSYMDTTANDETKVLYSVAAVGPGGTSKATVQTGTPAPGLAVRPKACQTHKIKPGYDSDGDGLTDAQEKTGWKIKIYQGTASIDNVSGTWQQDFTTETVKSNFQKADTDGDGLCDPQELLNGTDPTKADSDGDLLSDLAELDTWGSDPDNVDTDLDSFNPVITIKGNTETVAINQAKGRPELYDGNEVQTYHTSPALFDTDGDGYSDYNEILSRGGEFNPLVANLPEIELSQAGNVNLYVNIGYSNSTKKAQAKTTSLQQGQSSSKTDSSSTTQKWWESVSETVSIGYKGGGFTGSASETASTGYSNTQTTGWSKTTTQSSQKTYADAVSAASEQGRTISGGKIGIAMNIHNPTPVAYTLSNLAVTALQRELQPDGSFTFKPITTLSFDKALSGGIYLAPGATKQDFEVSQDLKAGNVILGLMAHPSSLMFEVSNFALSNSAGVNYAFMQETAQSRTAFLTIDYANGNPNQTPPRKDDVVRAHIATNVKRKNGNIVGITLKEALRDLGIKYKTTKVTDKNGKTYTVLSQLYDNAAQEWVSATKHKFWTTTVSGSQTAPLEQNFGDIVLQPGSNAFLLFVQDQDQDGLFLRDETRLGTSDTKKDTDGDGLNDYFEAKKGWDVKPPQALPLYPLNPSRRVFSHPTLADADHDGLSDSQEYKLGTDPNNPDTDNDGLCDGPGSSASPSGPCTKGAKQDPQPLVPRFARLSESPTPYSITTAQNDLTISANFSVPLKVSSTFSVHSNLRGTVAGKFSFTSGGRTITFTPKSGNAWFPGEVLTVSLNNITADATGKKLPVYQYRFRAAANKAGQFDGNSPAHHGEPGGGTVVQAITGGDFNQDGLLDLAYVTTNDKKSEREQVMVDLQSGNDFSRQTYTLNSGYNKATRQPNGIATGDFNNDGRLDLAVTAPAKHQVAVLLAGQTRGTFSDPVYYWVGLDPVSVAVADFNDDGNLDLVTANQEDNNQNAVSLWLGNGGGTFPSGKTIPLTGLSSHPHPTAIAAGDFNGDGIPDIITAYQDPNYGGGVYINLGNGDGTFQGTGKVQDFQAGAPVAIATGDFNGDGWLDVVTANQDNTVSLLLNDAKGDSVFTVEPNTTVSSSPTTIMTADFNGDGGLDIAVANGPNGGHGNSATVLYGQQNSGVFQRQDLSVEGKVDGRLQAFGLTTVLTGGHLNLVLAGSSPDNSHGELVFFPAQ